MQRPYIPLKVRLAVLERQAFHEDLFENDDARRLSWQLYMIVARKNSMASRIKYLLELIFHGAETQLDHDPALSLRRINKRTGNCIPAANNPQYLVYRLKPDHLRKTTGRRPGAERTITTKGSDHWLAKKFRKLERPKKSKSKLQSRPFPKAKRPLRSRMSSSATHAGKGF